MITEKIEGLIAAPYTPMNKDCSINTGVIRKYADKLKSDGLKGVFVCGTTGEGMLMTSRERMDVAEKWIVEQTENFRVIIHVGTTSSRQSFELAKHASDKGAYAIGSMGPMFLKPSTVTDLVDFCAEVAAGAPELPFYYYHIPSVSGINLSMSEFLMLAGERIPNIAGIKFTDNNFMEMLKCIRLNEGKWDILHGYDELLLAGLSFGAKGAVGSTYNFMAPLYYSIIDDFNNGKTDQARDKQFLSVKVINMLIKYGGAIAAGKALMKSAGIDCGPCRSPIKNIDDDNLSDLTKQLKELQLSDYI